MRQRATTEMIELAERTCHGCSFLRTFKARPDEQQRYGFGETGYGCQEPGYEGYVNPKKPICVRGPYLRATKDGEARR
jgi:hypothetical protein